MAGHPSTLARRDFSGIVIGGGGVNVDVFFNFIHLSWNSAPS